jgi:hypothetical protein
MWSRNPIKYFSKSKTKFWKPWNPRRNLIHKTSACKPHLLTSKVETPNSPNRVCSNNCRNETTSNNCKEGSGGGNTNPNLLAPNGHPETLTCTSLLPPNVHPLDGWKLYEPLRSMCEHKVVRKFVIESENLTHSLCPRDKVNKISSPIIRLISLVILT